MSTWSVCAPTSRTSRSISASLDESAATGYALPGFPSLSARPLSASQAAWQACALREVMKILEHPAWRSLALCWLLDGFGFGYDGCKDLGDIEYSLIEHFAYGCNCDCILDRGFID